MDLAAGHCDSGCRGNLMRWLRFEAVCQLAANRRAKTLHYLPARFRAVYVGEYDGGSIARIDIDAKARALVETAPPCVDLPRAMRRSARRKSTQSRNGVCDYCHGAGQKTIGEHAVVCLYCGGSGKTRVCTVCRGSGKVHGRPCSCDAAPPYVSPQDFKTPYDGRAGVTAIPPDDLARMLRRAGMQ